MVRKLLWTLWCCWILWPWLWWCEYIPLTHSSRKAMIFLMNWIRPMLAISVYSLQIVFVPSQITQCGVILLAGKYVAPGCWVEAGNRVSISFGCYTLGFLGIGTKEAARDFREWESVEEQDSDVKLVLQWQAVSKALATENQSLWDLRWSLRLPLNRSCLAHHNWITSLFLPPVHFCTASEQLYPSCFNWKWY